MTTQPRVSPPLLTICIPTYNRYDLLRQGLQAIAQQMTEIPLDQVEIIVSDNASSDQTRQVIERFTQEYKDICLRYFRHPQTIKGDANIYGVTKLARGDYVFLVSDDDILLPGAISKILAEIRKRPGLGALCPNLYIFSADPGVVAPTLYHLEEDHWLVDYDQILESLGRWVTFISCVIFRRENVKRRDYTDKTMTPFPHSYLFLDILKNEHGCLIIEQPCLAVRANDQISWDLVHAYATEFANLLEYAESNGFSKRARKSVLSANALWLAGAIYHFKKTSYRPNLLSRVGDSLKVLVVWWREPLILLRVVAAIWLPFPPSSWLRGVSKLLRVRGRQ
ncbi:MAG: glycosyltransferase family 2 protein [Armatimonadota bacterium]